MDDDMAVLRQLFMRCGLVVALLALALLPAAGHPARAQDEAAWQILSLVNQARAAAGVGPLTMNGALVTAAQRHSSDMAANNFLGHTGSDGSTVDQRVSQAGYTWATLGENAAQTWGVDAGQVVSLWLGSDGHRANLLNPAFIDMGVAYATGSDGAVYYAQTFGAQPGAVPPPAEPPPPTPIPPTPAPPTPIPPTPAPPTPIPATSTPLPSATPPPTWTPAAWERAPESTPGMTNRSGGNPAVILLLEEPGIPWTLWFQRLPVGYRPVNAQGIALLPEDGIPPELWFQVPPALP